jgi:hypothetical protein
MVIGNHHLVTGTEFHRREERLLHQAADRGGFRARGAGHGDHGLVVGEPDRRPAFAPGRLGLQRVQRTRQFGLLAERQEVESAFLGIGVARGPDQMHHLPGNQGADGLDDVLMQLCDVSAAGLVDGRRGGKAADGTGPPALGTHQRSGLGPASDALDGLTREEVLAALARVPDHLVVLPVPRQLRHLPQAGLLGRIFAEEQRGRGGQPLVVGLRRHAGCRAHVAARKLERAFARPCGAVLLDHLVKRPAVVARAGRQGLGPRRQPVQAIVLGAQRLGRYKAAGPDRQGSEGRGSGCGRCGEVANWHAEELYGMKADMEPRPAAVTPARHAEGSELKEGWPDLAGQAGRRSGRGRLEGTGAMQGTCIVEEGAKGG